MHIKYVWMSSVYLKNHVTQSKLNFKCTEFRTEILKSLDIEKWTYSASCGNGHILQLILPVVSKAWGFNSHHLKPNLQPESFKFVEYVLQSILIQDLFSVQYDPSSDYYIQPYPHTSYILTG